MAESPGEHRIAGTGQRPGRLWGRRQEIPQVSAGGAGPGHVWDPFPGEFPAGTEYPLIFPDAWHGRELWEKDVRQSCGG